MLIILRERECIEPTTDFDLDSGGVRWAEREGHLTQQRVLKWVQSEVPRPNELTIIKEAIEVTVLRLEGGNDVKTREVLRAVNRQEAEKSILAMCDHDLR
jgi:hypothetical protein